MTDMEGYSISALDGVIGEVKDYYFDDVSWIIRYLVVETGDWLASRKVLISPASINGPNWSEKSIPAAITLEQVRNSPPIDTHKPVSRQHEVQHLEHYNIPRYWNGPGLWGAGAFPSAMISKPDAASSDEEYRRAEKELESLTCAKNPVQDSHLRSGNTVVRYHVHAADGDIGHVQAILIDERTWAIRYFVVNTSNWWFGHEVLIAPQWIGEINWATSKILLPFKRCTIKDAPPYDPNAQLDRTQEARIYAHHHREGYWSGEAKDEAAIPHLGP
ncbi:MAG: PRC-barrel domain containing protein [Steroidobacteraceae bacterium]